MSAWKGYKLKNCMTLLPEFYTGLMVFQKLGLRYWQEKPILIIWRGGWLRRLTVNTTSRSQKGEQ